jgi:hypothetical protein
VFILSGIVILLSFLNFVFLKKNLGRQGAYYDFLTENLNATVLGNTSTSSQ